MVTSQCDIIMVIATEKHIKIKVSYFHETKPERETEYSASSSLMHYQLMLFYNSADDLGSSPRGFEPSFFIKDLVIEGMYGI